MRKFWRQIRVITLMATLLLTAAVPTFATDKAKTSSDCVESNRISFEDLIVSSLILLPGEIVAAVQKVREAFQ